MTRRTRVPLHNRRIITNLASAVSLVAVVLSVIAWPQPVAAARIAQAYAPGVTADGLGGDLVVNSYRVDGLGLHRMSVDEGSTAAAVCIQADVPHSTAASYQAATAAANSGALDYLTWRHLRGGSLNDVQAAGLNLAAWALTGARRNGGGAVWQGGQLTVMVLGVGPRDDIESAALSYLAAATRRRGPWALEVVPGAGSSVSVRLGGPGGPIEGEPITFTTNVGLSADVVTNAEGLAMYSAPDAAAGTTVRATASGPGRSVEYTAPGAQRLAVAGPPTMLEVEVRVPATPTTPSTTTTTTLTPSTSTTSTTTTLPATMTTTTLPATTTTTTTTPTTPASTTTTSTTTAPPDATVTTTPPPASPEMPITGNSSRAVVRIGALLFAIGSIAMYVAAGLRRNPVVREVDPDGRDL